ncbi:hypothetical protein FITA111629_07565 [Filibacter tadaridae]|uniref:Uncharacterized protein n=1 Tax=Filibacter tadaridae TaxID=2483811 RepID=A0A3P5XKG4_9BACL|nr:hypothetical protein [Filibacter tadaridae]VDC28168.1 hypothetical protein FILTAD_01787 [Filibacter tadaridae]
MYFTKAIPSHPHDIHLFFNKWSPTKKMMFTALMAALATILQSAGGLLPSIGYFISPFATAPILLGALISFRSGVLAYVLTIFLLVVIQPTELIIFPFTTGLLGLVLGSTFRALNRRLGVLLATSLLLVIGICVPLYGLGFPVFGPTISSSFSMLSLLIIFGFSLLYSWFWLEFGLYFLRKIKAILGIK